MTQDIGIQQSDANSMAALRWRLSQSPTGRQLAIDGSFILPLEDDDPGTSDKIPADGTIVMYDDSGTLELWGFTRATGWQQV